MSAVFSNSVTPRLERTSGLVAANSDYTGVCWLRVNGVPAAPDYQTVFGFANAGYTAWAGIWGYDDASGKFAMSISDGSTTVTTTGKLLTVGKWYHMAYVRTGNTHKFYVNGTLIGSAVLNITALTWATLYCGNDTFSVGNVDIAFFREWNVVLSDDEIFDEASSILNVKTASLSTNTPLQTNLTDLSGNGHNWTSFGSVTFGTDPPIPTNGNATNAEVLSVIPSTGTRTVKFTNCDLMFNLWFKHVAPSTGNVLGFYAQGNNSTYRPITYVFSPDSVTTYLNLSLIRNLPIQFPVISGTTYYIKVKPTYWEGSGDLTLTLNGITVDGGVPAGSIGLNDDKEGFPLALLSSTSSTILGFIRGIAAGDAGDIFDNGIVVLSSLVTTEDEKAFVYDSKHYYKFQTSLTPFPAAGATARFTRAMRLCRGTQHIWMGITFGTDRQARYIQNDGLTMGAVHTLTGVPDLACVAATNDETVLWFGRHAESIGIGQWDLVGDTLIGYSLGAVGYAIADMLMLSDNTIVVAYYRSTTHHVYVKRYNLSGTTLNTYDYGTNNKSGNTPRMAFALDDPDSFWIMTHSQTPLGPVTFTNTKISDGSVLAQVTYLEYEGGIYINGSQGSTPTSFFGVSNSCPFWIHKPDDLPAIPFGSPPPPPGGGEPPGFFPPGTDGGVLKMVPTATGGPPVTHDTYYGPGGGGGDFLPVKIPDPLWRTALMGD